MISAVSNADELSLTTEKASFVLETCRQKGVEVPVPAGCAEMAERAIEFKRKVEAIRDMRAGWSASDAAERRSVSPEVLDAIAARRSAAIQMPLSERQLAERMAELIEEAEAMELAP